MTVAGQKIDGLRKHYGIDSPKGLGYFAVHEEADVRHRDAWRGWLEKQSDVDRQAVLNTTEDGLKALWGALDAVYMDSGCRTN